MPWIDSKLEGLFAGACLSGSAVVQVQVEMQANLLAELDRYVAKNLDLLQMEYERHSSLKNEGGLYLIVVELATWEKAARSPYLIHSSGLSGQQQANMPIQRSESHFPVLFLLHPDQIAEAGTKHAWRVAPL